MSTQEHRLEEEHFSEDKLLDYLNIELSFDEMVSVESHVSRCNTCKEAMRELEPRSNKKTRDAEFEHLNAIFNKAEIKRKPFYFSKKHIFVLLFVIITGVVSALYYNGSITIPFQQLGAEEASFLEEEVFIAPEVQPILAVDSILTHNEEDVVVVNIPVAIAATHTTAPEVGQQIDTPIEQVRIQPETSIEEPSEEIVDEEIAITPVQTMVVALEEPDCVVAPIPEAVPEIVPISKGSVVALAAQPNQPVPKQGLAQFNNYISSNFVYPAQAKQNQVEGSVVVQFVVTLNGAVGEFEIIKSLGNGCDTAAKNLIKNGPSWKTYISDDFVEYKTATVEFVFKL